MINLSKQEEKKPFAYSSIEMRKNERNYFWWIVGIVVIGIVIYFVLKILTILY